MKNSVKTKMKAIEAGRVKDNGNFPYIEIGENKNGDLYYNTIASDNEEILTNVSDAVAGAMLCEPRLAVVLMHSVIKYISEMGGEEEADRVMNVLLEGAEKRCPGFIKKNNSGPMN